MDKRIKEDRDYIKSPKYQNSLTKLLEDNPDGVSDQVICSVLGISPWDLNKIYERAILKLRNHLARGE
jgi:hypothetical protein